MFVSNCYRVNESAAGCVFETCGAARPLFVVVVRAMQFPHRRDPSNVKEVYMYRRLAVASTVAAALAARCSALRHRPSGRLGCFNGAPVCNLGRRTGLWIRRIPSAVLSCVCAGGVSGACFIGAVHLTRTQRRSVLRSTLLRLQGVLPLLTRLIDRARVVARRRSLSRLRPPRYSPAIRDR